MFIYLPHSLSLSTTSRVCLTTSYNYNGQTSYLHCASSSAGLWCVSKYGQGRFKKSGVSSISSALWLFLIASFLRSWMAQSVACWLSLRLGGFCRKKWFRIVSYAVFIFFPSFKLSHVWLDLGLRLLPLIL